MPKWKTAAAEINLGGKERRYLGYSATIRTKTGKKPQKVTQFISLFPQIAFKQLMLYHNRVNQCFKCLSSAKVLNKRALHSWFILVWLRNREKKQGFFLVTARQRGGGLLFITSFMANIGTETTPSVRNATALAWPMASVKPYWFKAVFSTPLTCLDLIPESTHHW